MENENILVQFVRLTKKFGDFKANDDLTFNIRKGEIHCLLGENGAGKSTLSECLYGTYKPDGGKIFFKGKEVVFNSPRDAIAVGIGMVHQHFVLVPPMTVLENIIAGTAMPGIHLQMDAAFKKVSELCKIYDIDLDLNKRVSQLSVGKQQWVEILKALYLGVELLILDEPTAVLTPQEAEKLFVILNEMRKNNISIILITHKLKEVMDISDRVTVLRKGKLVGPTVNTSSMTMSSLATQMVGREVIFRLEKSEFDPGEIVLNINKLSFKNKQEQEILDNISLEIHEGEILGLAGVAGNGQQELFDTLVGVTRASSGQISIGNKCTTCCCPQEIINCELSSIPPDRIKQGLIMSFPVSENLILGRLNEHGFSRKGFLNKNAIEAFATKSITDFDISVISPGQKTRMLSGGNLQKIILARELSQNPKCVVASSPTRGLDIGATEYVHQFLLNLREHRVGILLISEDLDEIFNLSDRIAVIYRGKIMGYLPPKREYLETLGLMMAGVQKEIA